jgi:hypothetical protein
MAINYFTPCVNMISDLSLFRMLRITHGLIGDIRQSHVKRCYIDLRIVHRHIDDLRSVPFVVYKWLSGKRSQLYSQQG